MLWSASVERLTVNMNMPFSACVTSLIVTCATSSLLIVLEALAVVSVVWPAEEGVVDEGFESVDVNTSAPYTRVPPGTWILIVFVRSPGANVTVPLGNTPPTKSAASTALLTAYSAVFSTLVRPVRATVNVYSLLTDAPSICASSLSLHDALPMSLLIVLEALAVVSVVWPAEEGVVDEGFE